MSVFLKQVKYPCIKNVPGYSDLHNGSGKLAIPYKYLEILDPLCFTEIQPTVYAGTAHAIRNAADVSRACDLLSVSSSVAQEYSVLSMDNAKKWMARGATEHMITLGGNKLTDCLFVLGPNLVPIAVASGRGTGCEEMDCLPRWKASEQGSALGAGFGCEPNEEGNGKECTPCRKCDPEDDSDPCCNVGSCADKMNQCCSDPPGQSSYFNVNADLYFPYSQISSNSTFPSGRVVGGNSNTTIKHLGYLLRKNYDGYANLSDNSANLFSCPIDLFCKYMQSKNLYNYKQDSNIVQSDSGTSYINRLKTISYVSSVEDIKKLLYNGYGIVISTNIGFSKKKNTIGVAYPDKIWYHSYAIIGYDDTKTDSDECLYIFANSWGDWNSGGNPSWGKLPKGAFIVTESHLKKMLNLERIDKFGCVKQTSVLNETTSEGCITDNDCVPWECDKKQTPMGYAFVLCFTDSLQPRKINYKKFIHDSNFYPQLKSQISKDTFDEPYKKLNNLSVNDIIENPNITPSIFLIKNNEIFTNANIDEKLCIDKFFGYTKSPFDMVKSLNAGTEATNFNFANNSGEYLVEKYKTTKYVAINDPKLYRDNYFYHTKVNSKSGISTIQESIQLNSLEIDNLKIEESTFKFNNITTSIIECSNAALMPVDLSEYKTIKINCNIAQMSNTQIGYPININANYIAYLGDSSANFGIINGMCYLKEESFNNGTINGDTVLEESPNNIRGIINGNCILRDATNLGRINGNAYFKGESINSGIINGDGHFWKDAKNEGEVYGQVFIYEQE
jgi:hypothetical protein